MSKIKKNKPEKILEKSGFVKEEPYKISNRIQKLLEKDKLWDYIVLDELNKKHIGDEKTKEVVFLCAIGRLVKNKKSYSYNCLVLSSSSAGKDHLLNSVLKLFSE